jgi:hypothetical protein
MEGVRGWGREEGGEGGGRRGRRVGEERRWRERLKRFEGS